MSSKEEATRKKHPRKELDRNASQTLQEQLAEDLIGQIERDFYRKGDRFPSLRALADYYGVSRETSKFALEILEKRGYVEIRRGKGAYVLGERIRPNAWGHRSRRDGALDSDELAGSRQFGKFEQIGGAVGSGIAGMIEEGVSKTGNLGIIIDLGDAESRTDDLQIVYGQLQRYLDEEACEKSYQVLTAYINFDQEGAPARVARMLDKVDGVLVLGMVNQRLYRRLTKISVPVVSIMASLDITDIDDVGINNRKSSYRAVGHLLERGYRQIVQIDGPNRSSLAEQRCKGCFEAVADFNALEQKRTEAGSAQKAHISAERGAVRLKKFSKGDFVRHTGDLAVWDDSDHSGLKKTEQARSVSQDLKMEKMIISNGDNRVKQAFADCIHAYGWSAEAASRVFSDFIKERIEADRKFRQGFYAGDEELSVGLSARWGVAAVNDVTAAGVLQACRELGLEIPQDVGIIGGKNTSISSSIDPPMSSLECHFPELARLSLERLLQRIQGLSVPPVRMELTADVVQRSST